MGDGRFRLAVDGEIPLLSSFLYLLDEAERVRRSLRRRLSRCSRAKRVEWCEVCRARAVSRAAHFGVSCGRRVDVLQSDRRYMLPRDPIRGHCQAGSSTGAVHLSKNNAGVLRPAQRGQKPRVEQKGKSWLDLDVQYA